MHWDVRAVTTPSSDTDLSLLVTFDHAKYLFNCGEGTQRSFVQSRTSMRKLEGIYMTSANLDVVGGLPGMLMSAADAGIKHLDVAGPEGVAHYLATCRTFVQREGMTVALPTPDATAGGKLYQSAALSIFGIPIGTSSGIGQARSEVTEVNWSDPDFRLKDLSDEQLQKWRRTIVLDMFKPPPPSESAADASSKVDITGVPSVKLIRQNGTASARMYMSQSLPRYGADIDEATRINDERMAYILQAPPVRGKFNAEKAKALGVPNGPIRGKLTKGEAIEVDDTAAPGGKRIIKPEDVLGDGHPGGVCILVDVAIEHVPTIVSNPAFQPYLQLGTTAPQHSVHLVVHRISQEVAQDARYQEWVHRFGRNTHHLIADPLAYQDAVSFSSSAWNLLRLSLLDDMVFSVPTQIQTKQKPEQTAASLVSAFSSSVSAIKAGHQTKMHPPATPNVWSPGPGNPAFPLQHDVEAAKSSTSGQMSKYLSLAAEAKRRVSDTEGVGIQNPKDYGIEVTPLGTGSAIPSKYRNVSSTLVDIPDFGSILLDAGEGTLGQLRRRFGTEGVQQVYGRLRILYISHMHADHHIGLRRVLLDRMRYDPVHTLYIIGPSYILLHLRENGIEVGDHHGKTRFIDNFHLSRSYEDLPVVPVSGAALDGSVTPAEEQTPQLGKTRRRHIEWANECKEELGLETLSTPEVKHRGRAYGLVIAHHSGWKVVYSGDTMPCDSLVRAGQDATLLIHEATLEDDKPDMALAKGHSTFGQAIEVGTRMQAKYLLLNHFSQRYPKLPRLQAPMGNELGRRPVIALAFDLMTLPLSSFWKMEYYTDALEELFVEVEGAESEMAQSEAGDAVIERAKGKGKAAGQAKANGNQSEIANTNKRKRRRDQPGNDKLEDGDAINSARTSAESRASKRSKGSQEEARRN